MERLGLAADHQDGVFVVGPRALADRDLDPVLDGLEACSRSGFEQNPVISDPRMATSSRLVAPLADQAALAMERVWIRLPVAGSQSQ